MTVYEIITDRIIKELENGRIPWQKPWTGVRTGAYSYATGKPYSLLNQMLLGTPGEYLTRKQAEKAGGKIREGEEKNGSIVVYWNPQLIVQKDKDGKEISVTVPFLKYFYVYHINQCEGVEPRFKEEKLPDFNPIEKAETILAEYSARTGCRIIVEKGNRAYYTPTFDEVHLPLREQFPEPAEFYATGFHEVTHSTGHPKRLNRLDNTAHFGNDVYSKEELVAEIGAATLMNETGIETPKTFKNSAAYIQSWLRVLKSDARMVVSAAGKAEKAVKLILNVT